MRVGKAQGLRRLPRTRPGPHELDALRLGKKAAAQPEAERLHRQLDRYAYGPLATSSTTPMSIKSRYGPGAESLR